ncbi:MAG: spore germination protein [Firmicutes bacterium]|nr:spore germination protein [Bacillota bacterium]
MGVIWGNLRTRMEKGLVVSLISRVWRRLRRRKKTPKPQDFAGATLSELFDFIKSQELVPDLKENEDRLKQILGDSSDLTFRHLMFGRELKVPIMVVHVDGMVGSEALMNGLIGPVLEKGLRLPEEKYGDHLNRDELFALIKQQVLLLSSVHEVAELEEVLDYLVRGHAVLLIDGVTKALACEVKGWSERNVEQPTTEVVVRGPQHAFVENRRVNTTLLRRTIASPLLWFEDFKVGAVTNTIVTIAYIKGIVDDGLVEEVRQRIKSIEIDAVFESGYIEELIEDAPYSPFPTILRTERPDKVAAGLLEGRVAIIIDGTPYVLVIPATFATFLTAAEDYYERAFTGSFIRAVRAFAFFLALTLPSTYVAITNFHQELLPTSLTLSIAAQREGVPFVAILEALFLEFSFELLREAGIRLPKAIGPTISIVGALILGEAAVSAGLVSPALVIVVAATAIASFISPIYSMSISVHLLRFPMIILAGTLGLFGVIMGLAAILIHLCAVRSFGVPYLTPLAPMILSEWKDTVVRLPLWQMDTRPKSLVKQEYIRQSPRQRPQPPKQDDN